MDYPCTVSLIGGTGLVGHELLLILSHLPMISNMKVVTRKPLGRMPARIENIILDFDKMSAYKEHLKAEIFICCLGSTIKKAGSQEAFEKVDYDYVMQWAKIAEECNAKKFIVISAMGADADSKIFYNRVKGRMEQDLKKLNIPQIEIFRPSLILGERNEKRTGEDIAQKMAPVMNALLWGPLRKYRAIRHSAIAKAMAVAALNYHEGRFTYESDHIQRIADQSF